MGAELVWGGNGQGRDSDGRSRGGDDDGRQIFDGAGDRSPVYFQSSCFLPDFITTPRQQSYGVLSSGGVGMSDCFERG